MWIHLRDTRLWPEDRERRLRKWRRLNARELIREGREEAMGKGDKVNETIDALIDERAEYEAAMKSWRRRCEEAELEVVEGRVALCRATEELQGFADEVIRLVGLVAALRAASALLQGSSEVTGAGVLRFPAVFARDLADLLALCAPDEEQENVTRPARYDVGDRVQDVEWGVVGTVKHVYRLDGGEMVSVVWDGSLMKVDDTELRPFDKAQEDRQIDAALRRAR